MADPSTTAAEQLRARLKKLEWSQLDLATAIGVNPGVVSRWVSGERSPSLEMAFRIQKSKVAIPAESWITHATADESGPRLPNADTEPDVAPGDSEVTLPCIRRTAGG